jgi:hypothetical protein
MLTSSSDRSASQVLGPRDLHTKGPRHRQDGLELGVGSLGRARDEGDGGVPARNPVREALPELAAVGDDAGT